VLSYTCVEINKHSEQNFKRIIFKILRDRLVGIDSPGNYMVNGPVNFYWTFEFLKQPTLSAYQFTFLLVRRIPVLGEEGKLQNR
jgi:hypothetical protein